MKAIFFFFLLCLNAMLFAQPKPKKQLTHEDLVTWKRIENPLISNDGLWVAYTLKAEEGDAILKLWNPGTGKTHVFDRGEEAAFTADNQYLLFKIRPHQDSLKAQRRRKVKKDDLTKDSLCILALSTQTAVKIPNVKSFAVPEKWSGWVAIHKEVEKPDTSKTAKPSPVDSLKMVAAMAVVPDSSLETGIQPEAKPASKKKPKKESKDNGTKLIIRELATGNEKVVPFAKDFRLAREGQRILLTSTGNDSTWLPGVYLFDGGSHAFKPMFRQKGEFKQLALDEKGRQVAFLANLDTTKSQVAPLGLCFWREGLDSANLIADTVSHFLPLQTALANASTEPFSSNKKASGKRWLLSENARPNFSKDGSKLFFGIAPPPILPDTNLLDEEIVNVEVWKTDDGRMHTQQKVRLDDEKKRSYQVVWHVAENQFVPLAAEDLPEIQTGNDGNAPVALGTTELPYLQFISWEGTARKDVFLIDLKTGGRKEIAKALRGTPRLSPEANFAIWFNEVDSAWFAYSLKNNQLKRLTTNTGHPFFDEQNDVPDFPNAYGVAAWTKDDRYVLVYDRYDIWQIDPTGNEPPLNLTNGRARRTVYRYLRLDPEERFVAPGQRLLLHVFDEKTRASGYAILLLGAGQPIHLVQEDFSYSKQPKKAKDADRLIFTKENYQTFPDLRYSDFTFQKTRQVSHANPQQADYQWGNIELVEWTALDGQRLQGLLVKPEGFDPKKKYPMVVNFYERSSDELHLHRSPYPHRSSINYTFYASRGYLVFNPDIPYRQGYPGESCYNAVVPGVTSLIDKGFVDTERIGVQGHSWGGYQVAYLLTKTDLFRCAESGAPVVNMFSAYGGIRWESGLSRMFQYEKTQSRIGGSIWQYPLRYLENSPLFFMDKVNTPVLILHNDKDGAVPWYQGIEYFTALRRLGKPAWLLNYNDEPHWPLKLQNRKDFQLRMSQYFDYFLKDAPMPRWMERGVPAMEKGILQGLEAKE